MARLCLVLLLVVGAALAKPSLKKVAAPKKERSVTYDDLKNGCVRMLNNSQYIQRMSIGRTKACWFSEYMVPYIYDNIEGACNSEDELTCLVGLINGLKEEKNPTQKSVQDKIKATCPAIYARLENINTSYEADFARLSSDAQAYLNDFNAAVMKVDRKASQEAQATNYICILIKFLKRLDSNSDIVSSLKTVWPGPMSGYEKIKSCKYYGMFKMMTSKMTDKTCPSFVGSLMKLGQAKSNSFAMMG